MLATRSRLLAALLAGAALVLAGCGGSDDEQTAQTTVCDARAKIGTSVNSLTAMTSSTVTADAVRGELDTIKSQLETIRDAQDELSDDRRAQISKANKEFAAEIRDVGATILRSTSVEEARTRVKSAVDQLGNVYRSTLATVDCG